MNLIKGRGSGLLSTGACGWSSESRLDANARHGDAHGFYLLWPGTVPRRRGRGEQQDGWRAQGQQGSPSPSNE